MNNILAALMLSNGWSIEQAKTAVNEMLSQILSGASPFDVVLEYGLEIEYIENLLDCFC